MLSRSFVARCAGVASVLAAAACADSPTAVQESSATFRGTPSYNIAPTSAGTFFSFTPDNVGPEFWDLEPSIDGAKCNIGYFAIGDFGPNCAYERAGTSLYSGGFSGGTFLGTNSGTQSANFTLPAGTYKVSFQGGLRGAGTGGLPENTIGYYSGVGAGKVFTPFADVNAGTVANITVATDWGLYISPGTAVSNPSSFGACGTSGSGQWCSGEGTSMWAMFKSADGLKYLFGVEDSPDAAADSDYNDHFIAFEKILIASVGTGRMTGGVTIPSDLYRNLKVSLTIHCDNKLSNNIQINWNNGENWHLDKNSLSDIVCQKVADPRPPVADIDVFTGNATGTLNNQSGSKLSFTFFDRGEPGREDRVSLKITDPSGNVVLNVVDAQVRTGNLQAHIDQPHKK